MKNTKEGDVSATSSNSDDLNNMDLDAANGGERAHGVLQVKTKWDNDDEDDDNDSDEYSLLDEAASRNRYDFTGFRDTRLKIDQPVEDQLRKELKRMVYSKRKSAKEFYEKESNESYDAVGEEP